MVTMKKMWPQCAAAVFASMGLVAGCSSSNNAASSNAPTPPPPSSAPSGPAASTTSASVDGSALFAQDCAGCHGDKGAGGRRAPKLAGRNVPTDKASQIISDGKGRMPPFKSRLSQDQVGAIAKYVTTL